MDDFRIRIDIKSFASNEQRERERPEKLDKSIQLTVHIQQNALFQIVGLFGEFRIERSAGQSLAIVRVVEYGDQFGERNVVLRFGEMAVVSNRLTVCEQENV